MNNTKVFIVIILLLAGIAAFSEIFFVFFGSNNTQTEAVDQATLLPTSFDQTIVDALNDRATRYLSLTPNNFESGVAPDSQPTVSPTPSF